MELKFTDEELDKIGQFINYCEGKCNMKDFVTFDELWMMLEKFENESGEW